MFKKSVAFGLLAAGLMIAPTAAFAGGQSQSNQQSIEQNGAASDGSTNAQSAQNISNQVQSQIRRTNPGYHYPRSCGSGSSYQDQNSGQGITQNGAASYGSTNAQDGSNHSNQVQAARAHHGC